MVLSGRSIMVVSLLLAALAFASWVTLPTTPSELFVRRRLVKKDKFFHVSDPKSIQFKNAVNTTFRQSAYIESGSIGKQDLEIAQELPFAAQGESEEKNQLADSNETKRIVQPSEKDRAYRPVVESTQLQNLHFEVSKNQKYQEQKEETTIFATKEAEIEKELDLVNVLELQQRDHNEQQVVSIMEGNSPLIEHIDLSEKQRSYQIGGEEEPKKEAELLQLRVEDIGTFLPDAVPLQEPGTQQQDTKQPLQSIFYLDERKDLTNNGSFPIADASLPTNSKVVQIDPPSVMSQQESSPVEIVHQGSSTTSDIRQTPGAVPSYIQLCTELIERKTNPVQPSTLFVVRESASVCQSNDSFASLLTIMASTFIAQGSGFWRLQYQPACEQMKINDMTIQQLLPQDLFFTLRPASTEVLNAICKTCVGGTDQSVACLGFPTERINGNQIDPVIVSDRILGFRHNIHVAAKAARRMERATDQPSPTAGGAVVFFDLESSENTSMAMPLSWYAERIPVSIPSIFVVVHQQCGNCVEHGRFVSSFLADMYPRAAVHFEILASTALIFAKMISAPYLLCPPTTACLLPALMRDVTTTTFIGDSPTLFPWFLGAVEKVTKTFHLQTEVTKAEAVEARQVQGMADLHPYLAKQPGSTSKTCEQLRGRLGHWEFDPEYGKAAQYVTPLKRFETFPDFVPTEAVPFRLPTMYKWVDNLCPVDLVTKKGFCQVMKHMDLTRIYLVGDSLQLQMAMSLWKLLGHDDEPVARPKDEPFEPWMPFNWERVIECDGHQIDFKYTRNDLMDDNNDDTYKSEKTGSVFNCGVAEFCMPWLKSYVDYTKGGTLLLANAGSHIRDVDSFPVVLRTFLSMMDANQRESDLVMLRTTVPGHEKCKEANVKPFKSHVEFKSELVADLQPWHLFSQFNDHLYDTVTSRNEGNTTTKINILDVYPMTVLRKDGHVSSAPMCSSCRKDDCLHYALPGPLDWWNHLLYSNLVNLESLKRAAAKPSYHQSGDG